MPRTYLGPSARCRDTDVFIALVRRSERRGMAPPAMLAGDWFGVSAVIAPSVALHRVPLDQFMVPEHLDSPPTDVVVGGGVVGSIDYPGPREAPRAYQCEVDEVLARCTGGPLL